MNRSVTSNSCESSVLQGLSFSLFRFPSSQFPLSHLTLFIIFFGHFKSTFSIRTRCPHPFHSHWAPHPSPSRHLQFDPSPQEVPGSSLGSVPMTEARTARIVVNTGRSVKSPTDTVGICGDQGFGGRKLEGVRVRIRGFEGAKRDP